MILLLGAVIDLVLRFMPTPKEVKEKEAKQKREQTKERINNTFGSGTDGTGWWVR